MQIIIDIPEEEYKDFCEMYVGSHNTVINAMCKGTPLPKGHGRLIDEERVSLIGVYFFGYFVGRKQILDEIKALSQELEEKEHDAIKM